MFKGIIGVFALGMVAVIVFQLARSGSQGPQLLNQGFGGIANIYGSLMK